jgi:glucose/arabinose dehydrogenase
MSRARWSFALSVVLAGVIAAGCPGSSGASGVLGPAPGYSFTQVASGFNSPVFVTSAPGDPDTLYVVEQQGTIETVSGGHITGTFLDISGIVESGDEQGLFSVAFSPNYATNHLFYVSYTNLQGNSRVAVYRSSHGRGVGSSGRILLAIHQPYSNHNGGQLEFDKRGYLYAGFGDGGSGGDPQQHAQNMHSDLGKLLRSSTKTPNTRWKIVGLGLRNPWRFSFDSKTNNLWIGDVGQNTWEEVDFRAASRLDTLANYGWSRYEGYSVYDASHTYSKRGQKVRPVFVYGHVNGQCSITGGYVYRGSSVPAAQGRYFYGDYCTGTIWSFSTGPNGRNSGPTAVDTVSSLSSFGTNGHGDLFAVSLDGTLYELK